MATITFYGNSLAIDRYYQYSLWQNAHGGDIRDAFLKGKKVASFLHIFFSTPPASSCSEDKEGVQSLRNLLNYTPLLVQQILNLKLDQIELELELGPRHEYVHHVYEWERLRGA